jgi:hypothetical protein
LAQNALPDYHCLMEIQERLTKLRPIYDEFFEIQMQIEDIEISLIKLLLQTRYDF